MSNVDEKSKAYLSRAIRIEQERRENADAKKDLSAEMKSAKLLKEEIAGINLAVKLHFMEDEKRQFRKAVEDIAESLGDYRDTPLGMAALGRHAS